MKRMLAAVLALLCLCGCSPNAREPDDLALVRVLGVDGASPVMLTAVCEGLSGQDVVRVSCRGETFGLARGQLPWAEGAEELALTNVGFLVVGRDVDLAALLFAVLDDRDLSGSAAVWLADDGAAALLADCEDPTAQLELLARQGTEGLGAAKALGALLTDGGILLPVVTQQNGRLILQGEEWWDAQ